MDISTGAVGTLLPAAPPAGPGPSAHTMVASAPALMAHNTQSGSVVPQAEPQPSALSKHWQQQQLPDVHQEAVVKDQQKPQQRTQTQQQPTQQQPQQQLEQQPQQQEQPQQQGQQSLQELPREGAAPAPPDVPSPMDVSAAGLAGPAEGGPAWPEAVDMGLFQSQSVWHSNDAFGAAAGAAADAMACDLPAADSSPVHYSYSYLAPPPAVPLAAAAAGQGQVPAGEPLDVQRQRLLEALYDLKQHLREASYNTQDPTSFTYYEDQFLGKGGFGCVYAGWYGGSIPVAVKKLNVALGEAAQLAQQEELVKELFAHLHTGNNHDNIIHVLAFCLDPPCIIMERCETSLRAKVEHLRQQQQQLHHHHQQQQQQLWPLWLGVLKQAAAAVSFLHTKTDPMLHTDLKADNMLLQHDGEPGQQPCWVLKVCDFNLAAWPLEGGTAHLQAVDVATRNPLWLAPELLAAQQLQLQGGGDQAPLEAPPVEATPAVDVYGLGCVMYEVLTGMYPWQHDPEVQAICAQPNVRQPVKLEQLRTRIRQLVLEQGQSLPFPGAPLARLPCLADPPPAGLAAVFEACCHINTAAHHAPEYAAGVVELLHGILAQIVF